MSILEVPEEFLPIMAEFLKQIEDFKHNYGYIPKCQLITSDHLKDLHKALDEARKK